jgi:cellulose synthase/poly-beta-1,6-N-acetylglucosamine synthase-like glycosyltransferase
MNPSEMLIRFRQLLPFQQAAIAGLIFFLIYILYSYFVLGQKPPEAARESVYSAIIFIVVYYFSSVIIMRKAIQAEKQAKGPRKGLRGK